MRFSTAACWTVGQGTPVGTCLACGFAGSNPIYAQPGLSGGQRGPETRWSVSTELLEGHLTGKKSGPTTFQIQDAGNRKQPQTEGSGRQLVLMYVSAENRMLAAPVITPAPVTGHRGSRMAQGLHHGELGHPGASTFMHTKSSPRHGKAIDQTNQQCGPSVHTSTYEGTSFTDSPGTPQRGG